MCNSILVTGTEGLIGTPLVQALQSRGEHVVCLDLRAPPECGQGDVRSAVDVARALHSCRGIVHLAAVSRVGWAERDPDLCWGTNVHGTRTVIEQALTSPLRPWVLLASSREVYGQPTQLPVAEDSPLLPVNVYGRSKVTGERLLEEAREAGLRTATVRLSNVYGSTNDHPDRVLPAFVRASISGATLRVDGADHMFDFTHVDDTVLGLVRMVELLDSGEQPPPVHLVSGQPVGLGEAARLVLELAGGCASIVEAPPPAYNVTCFYGDPERSRSVLGWSARTELRDGLTQLIAEHRTLRSAVHEKEVLS